MSVELEVRVSVPTTNTEIEHCIRRAVQRVFGRKGSQRLVCEILPNGSDSEIADMVIRLDDLAAVSAEFFDYDEAGPEESGNWCTLSANLARNEVTYALMCVMAVALANRFNTAVVDDALWLGITREISPTDLENRIQNHAGSELQSVASHICKSLGIGRTLKEEPKAQKERRRGQP